MQTPPHHEQRLGIATTWDGGAKFECALTLWCASARAFSAAVGASGGGVRSELVVLGTSTPSPECAPARYLLPRRSAAWRVLRRRNHANRVNRAVTGAKAAATHIHAGTKIAAQHISVVRPARHHAHHGPITRHARPNPAAARSLLAPSDDCPHVALV